MNYTNLLTLLLGFILGVVIAMHRSDRPSKHEAFVAESSVEIVYDTIQIVEPQPIAIEAIAVEAFSVASLESVLEVDGASTIEPLSIYRYSDTIADRWSATIVGRDVEFRELTFHDRTEYRTQTIYQPPKWEVVAQANLWSSLPSVGVNVLHNIGRLRISGYVGYDPYGRDVVIGASFGFAIWRRY